MVVKMMRWRPWPPLMTKKYEVGLVLRRLEGWDLVLEGAQEKGLAAERLTVEIRWKGPKVALSSLRRTVKRNFTKEVEVVDVGENGVVCWDDEEFQSVCSLSSYKENTFLPWEIGFTLFNGLYQGPKNKVTVIGTASLNLAEYASATEQKEFELNIPLTLSAGAGPATAAAVTAEPRPSLCISISLFELRTALETTELEQRAIVTVPSPPSAGETVSTERDELSAIKAGLRKKVKIFTEYVSARKAKKACREEGSEGRCSSRSEDGEYNYSFDSDSLDEFEEGESDERKEESSVRKSFSYGTLAYANCAGESFYSSTLTNGEYDDWVYYSHRKSDVGCSNAEETTAAVSEPSLLRSSKRSILPWKKRKLSFRSPKAKGEPLLKKANGEEGGDDIDFDRRQLTADEALFLGWNKTDEDSSANRSSVSEFGDDNFAIGSWEQKEVISRDGHMKLEAQVFFASIDQRSERAAGESACTALVAVIADWFQNNRDLMPIKSQFDSLIREGSLEWRNLCDNDTYRDRFPDKHFDLETVLQAKIRPLSVVPGKSFIGFFHPEGMDEGRFDFLHGAMSFDNIWDEISRAGTECPSNGEPQVYIVCWNDHFFILKVEPEAYYIIDTLGERLYEGCNQAYVLKFDCSTVIHKLPNVTQSSDEKPNVDQQIVAGVMEPKNQQVNGKEEGSVSVGGAMADKPEESIKSEEEEVVCRGKESCKEYIKSFLAALPIRELQADIKKGLMASTPLHHRLQIEFHYTQLLHSQPETPPTEAAAVMPQSVEVTITEAAA
ncbi:NT-C2 domain-containing protein [Cephalotus follicularis]|uniref:NT-C2 domain-containing protein n=1 Tax=Cephalotus follicularis TaxID=3775 RepID=A0A1Q3B7H3_CEPFO|nr:NT-C2 domain-containing protein [Cephalotus follicularis]